MNNLNSTNALLESHFMHKSSKNLRMNGMLKEQTTKSFHFMKNLELGTQKFRWYAFESTPLVPESTPQQE